MGFQAHDQVEFFREADYLREVVKEPFFLPLWTRIGIDIGTAHVSRVAHPFSQLLKILLVRQVTVAEEAIEMQTVLLHELL